MKLISSLAIALVAANEKKVPPRHPLNRLNTLTTFFTNFAADVVTPLVGAGYAGRLEGRMHGMTASMEKAFNRPNCGYYDETTKHGGPDPNPDHRENGKPRNRRDADDSDDDALGFTETLISSCDAGSFATNTDELNQDCCAAVANYSADCEKLPRRKGGPKKTAWERLSNDPATKWKQIMTGCRKWAERYINNCAGQRKNQLIKKRTKRVFGKVNEKLGF
jgi:hypothetical protein